jgi:hypothetical protein
VSVSINPNHKTVKVRNPFSRLSIPIDEKLAPLLSLRWKCDIETFSSCEEDKPGLAMISFLDAWGIETFYLVAKRTYFLQAEGVYHEDEDGNCEYCQVFLEVYFPAADIPRLVQAFTIYQRESQVAKKGKKK